MSKPIVAVVGRPNVGKSTFFNKIIGQRLSIVEDTPGVTRDRIYGETQWNGVDFSLIDTGGIETGQESGTMIPAQMREQAEMAMEMAHVVIFLVDGKDGLTSGDYEVAQLLRRKAEKVILVVNKIDHWKQSEALYDFYELGLGTPWGISAINMLNFGDVLDEIVNNLPKTEEVEDSEAISLAVIGKPNVGKSSLVNQLIGQNRVIVSPVAGTTRDSVDTPLILDGQKYNLIDTAGIRRKSKVDENIEKYSVIRAIAAIERCDVCLLMIDAKEGLTEQDKKIAGLAHESGKGLVLVVNKWDLVEKTTGTMEEYRKKWKNQLNFISYAPMLFISVKEKQRIHQVIQYATMVAENGAKRIPTGQLNNLIADCMMMKQPPADKGKRMKIYYATQVGVKPPLFSFQINSRKLVHFSYSRYLENKIRETFDFTGTPIKFVFREKGDHQDV